MEVHQLRYFCAIVKQGTFTRAAESEHVAQPSLSHQILKLENELGGKLFYRLPRAARLTPLGECFLPRALAILQEIRDSKIEAQKMNQLSSSQIENKPVLTEKNDGPEKIRMGQSLVNESFNAMLHKSA
jgi:LysR family transcriptional regulator, hydrogen peroxide-inducible genes activator